MSEAGPFVPEMAVATPKKRNRPKKKMRNDTLTNQPNSCSQNSQDVDVGKTVDRKESERINPPKGTGSNKLAIPDKKNSGHHQKKKINEIPSMIFGNKHGEVNNGQLQNHHIQKSMYLQEDRHFKAYESRPQDTVSHKERKQMELQQKQVEEERRQKWHYHFLTKPNDLLLLDRNKIFLLKSVEKSKPEAQLVCGLCNYFCDNMAVVISHIQKPVHLKHLKDYNEDITLRWLPELTMEQLAVLNSYLTKVAGVQGMNPDSLKTRRIISVLVGKLISTNLPGCSIRLFGSSVHGLGLSSADVNIDLQVPKDSLPSTILKAVSGLLKKSAHFERVVERFDCEFPYIRFVYKINEEVCSISLNNERAVNLAILLSKYMPLDPRLPQLATLFRYWGQMTETDNQEEGTWPGYAFYLMTIFYLQQLRDPVLPVLNNLLTEKGESESADTKKVLDMSVSDIKKKWKTKNKQNLASLWIGLLKFYSFEFDYTEYIVSIDSSTLIPRKTKKIFIVDPFLPTRNVARSVNSNSIFNYIQGCLVNTCRYFSMPQTKNGPLLGNIYIPGTTYHKDLEALLEVQEHINSQLIQLLLHVDPNFCSPQLDSPPSINKLKQLMHLNKFLNIDKLPVTNLDKGVPPSPQAFKLMSVSPRDANLIVSSVDPSVLEYNFTIFNCKGVQKKPIICGLCRKEGHLKDKCPEERLPPLKPLPERTTEAMSVLDTVCYFVFDKWRQTDEDMEIREIICEELLEFINIKHPSATLDLFGSTKNGFGLKGSDMDICLTFTNNKTGEGLDSRVFVEVLYKLLKKFKKVMNLLPIATAKVPILKFTHRATRLDGDISLYNVLAMENTKLLHAYAQIDERARILGYMMKRFSKVCRIGDASKGTLSSYAYTLLVIYFLQQCQPPVLPVLQELTESGGPPPKHIVEGCNAYFFKDISNLDKVWPGKNQNTQSVGELWLDLLIFYTSKFDLVKNVVCIRCSHVVTKFDKLWISKDFAIEDPFDLSHNLGSALTRKMSLYIIKALIKGRNHFGLPFNTRVSPKDIENYFFKKRALTDGELPNDRGCRICKSIGHKEKECQQKNKRRWNRPSKKKEGTFIKETPMRKDPINKSEDFKASFDGDEAYSNSDRESFDQEDLLYKQPERERNKRMSKKAIHQQILSREASEQVNTPDQLSKKYTYRKLTSEKDQQTNLPVHPGFFVQDVNQFPSTQFVHFPCTSPHKLPQNSTKVLSKSSDNSFVTQIPMSNIKQKNIPSVVFKNSKLITEPARKPATLIGYNFPSDQEMVHPPPAFISLPQNGQSFTNSIPFHHERNPGEQNVWNFTNYPLHSPTTMTSPKWDTWDMCGGIPVYIPPPPPFAARIASPRPSLQPAFNSHSFTSMLGPTQQLVWGQSSLPAAQPPSNFQQVSEKVCSEAPIHSLDMSIAKICINSPVKNNSSSSMDTAHQELENS